MKSILAYFSLSKINLLLVLPILYHSNKFSWLADFAITIANLNTTQSLFFYSFIFIIMIVFLKNSLLIVFINNLFSFLKSDNKIEISKNYITNLNPFFFFYKFNLFFFLKNKYKL